MLDKNYRYLIITIKVNKVNEVVEINYKLPSYIHSCLAIAYSVKEFLNPENIYFPEFGELSLQFNSRELHPLHLLIPYSNNPQEQIFEFMDFANPLEAGQIITGHYIDFGLSVIETFFQKYTVLVYLKCLIKTD